MHFFSYFVAFFRKFFLSDPYSEYVYGSRRKIECGSTVLLKSRVGNCSVSLLFHVLLPLSLSAFVCAGGLGEGGHESHSGHSPDGGDPQSSGLGGTRRAQPVEVGHQKRPQRGRRSLHVSNQYGSHEESGKKTKERPHLHNLLWPCDDRRNVVTVS